MMIPLPKLKTILQLINCIKKTFDQSAKIYKMVYAQIYHLKGTQFLENLCEVIYRNQ